ncbi:MAG TPA: hypothetical protein VD767_01415, partial [Thermomicrobiales bacterium]|nr:hypothetical protein [Thermomicrobiales bacterium]
HFRPYPSSMIAGELVDHCPLDEDSRQPAPSMNWILPYSWDFSGFDSNDDSERSFVVRLSQVHQ